MKNRAAFFTLVLLASLAALLMPLSGGFFGGGTMAVADAPSPPAQECGAGTSGDATIIGFLPQKANAAQNITRNTVGGFESSDKNGDLYIQFLRDLTNPPPPHSTPSPTPSDAEAKSIEMSRATQQLTQVMSFANMKAAPPTGWLSSTPWFLCKKLKEKTQYTFVATVYFNTHSGVATPLPGQTPTVLKITSYWVAKGFSGKDGEDNHPGVVQPGDWIWIGSNPPNVAAP